MQMDRRLFRFSILRNEKEKATKYAAHKGEIW